MLPLAIMMLIGLLAPTAQAADNARRFDFGAAQTEKGYVAVGAATRFSPAQGYGWLNITGLLDRDRSEPDALRRDFVFGKEAQTFRISGLPPGHYLLRVICGDMAFGNHVTRVKIANAPTAWPLLQPGLAEFATLTVGINVSQNTLDITFDSPQQNWIVNALSLEPTTTLAAPTVERQHFAPSSAKSTWGPVLTWPDPTKVLLDTFRQNGTTSTAPNFAPTGLTRADYLKLMASEVNFWKGHQAATGAIIDPYRKVEWQYSTPAFAHAATALVVWGHRKDLLEPAAKATDWAAQTLSERKAASGHEDFFAPMLAHTIPLLKPLVAPERAARWAAQIRGFNPFAIYRAAPGAGNWNVVSASGEARFQQIGLREAGNKFVENSFALQGEHFGSPYGLYLEGPMAYDHFPRLWAGDMIANGYTGPYHAELTEVLRRASITSLFMQSPWGELPAGGRSAHHQWNEAEQCVTYEIYAAQALKNGDIQLAGIYKRAAHLSLSSMRRWVRPSGEMQIVKNWVDPAQGHAFEGYSAHSQYNLLPMAMLAIAYDHAATTEAVAEQPAPADRGGYVLEIAPLHKVFANAGGTYIEIDTSADHHYDATGLIRVHSKGLSPQLGPSDSILAHPVYKVPANSPTTTTSGIGVAWKAADGTWHQLGELSAAQITKATVSNVNAIPQQVSFDLAYAGNLLGATRIIEHYTIIPGRVELTTQMEGYQGALRYTWPVLADDGKTPSVINVTNNTVSVSQDGGKTAQTFTPVGANSVRVAVERYPNHNGWARLGVAEYARGGKITLVIAPKVPLP